MVATRKKVEGAPQYIAGMTVGSFIAFTLPRLKGGHVYQDSHAGEIATFEEVPPANPGSMPKVKFTLKDQEREFTVRWDYEVRVP